MKYLCRGFFSFIWSQHYFIYTVLTVAYLWTCRYWYKAVNINFGVFSLIQSHNWLVFSYFFFSYFVIDIANIVLEQICLIGGYMLDQGLDMDQNTESLGIYFHNISSLLYCWFLLWQLNILYKQFNWKQFLSKNKFFDSWYILIQVKGQRQKQAQGQGPVHSLRSGSR